MNNGGVADGLTADGHDAQVATIAAFVRRERQERWTKVLGYEPFKRMKSIRLYDTREFDVRYLEPVPKHDHRPENIATLLRRLGSPEQVWLMYESVTEPWNLDAAIEDLWGRWGLLISIPGHLAYLETEVDGGFLLKR